MPALPTPFSQPSVDPLLEEVRGFIIEATPVNTKRSYNTYTKQFRAFQTQIQRTEVPAPPSVVAAFMKHLQERGLAANTINRNAVSAVANEHRLLEEDAPTRSKLIKAMKRAISYTAVPPNRNPKLPITTDLLLRIASSAVHNAKDTRDICMIVLMVAGFLRESEA